MTSFINAMMTADSNTNNGAVTNSTSSNYCLDLFFVAGASRNIKEDDLYKMFSKAYAEDRVKMLKILFWAMDIRQGAGERRFTKIALNWLNKHHPEELTNYVKYIPEFSRWDVLFNIENKSVFDFIVSSFKEGQNGLLFKWLPRKNFATDKKVSKSSKKQQLHDNKGNVIKSSESSFVSVSKTKRSLYNGLAHKIQKACGLTPRQYRKYIVEHSKTVEQQMCAKQWNEIEYSKVPSVAMHKYTKAWYRNDQTRFERYLESVKKGEAKINAGAIFPHDIIGQAVYSNSVRQLTDAEITQWNALPNYLEGRVNSILPICDTSGSMTWEQNALAMKISLAMGLYISERNEGPFKDAFITFSSRPQFQYLKGNINEKIQQLLRQDMGMNTDLEAVFDLILRKAITNNLRQEDMPNTVLIISDMEFDRGTSSGDRTTHKAILQEYAINGYKAPNIVYWNVNGRPGNVPVKMHESGAALISGASPSILKAIFSDNINPIKIMDNALEVERYSFIH